MIAYSSSHGFLNNSSHLDTQLAEWCAYRAYGGESCGVCGGIGRFETAAARRSEANQLHGSYLPCALLSFPGLLSVCNYQTPLLDRVPTSPIICAVRCSIPITSVYANLR